MVASTSADLIAIGEVARRSGLAPSAIRFYEEVGLVASDRTPAGHRVYPRHVLRRLGVIRIAQRLGLSLEEIREALEVLPPGRAPTKAEWARMSRAWRSRLDERIWTLEALRDELGSCIGCGCLSLQRCKLYNPDDVAAARGAGARYLLGDDPAEVSPRLRT
ncbi:MAG TPA: redox-sensitive transcriptional activator SoxR [Actinomycetota bacterium]|jgi:MerR family transcriptional regulator, redox-sensitive transcriptional activator SoxR